MILSLSIHFPTAPEPQEVAKGEIALPKVVGYVEARHEHYMNELAATYGIPREWLDIISRESDRNDLDPFLVLSVMRVESNFDYMAVSHMSARGLMQIMPRTGGFIASRLGEKYKVRNLFDVETNIRYGCWYLRHLLNLYDGNLELALSAYNAGPGRIRQIGIDPYRLYVAKVLYHYGG
jgi:soluble lytic murein transglycosylase-like protein